MNALYIVTAYVFIDDGLKAQHYQDDPRVRVSTAEILTVAVVAARFFQNHHERTLCLLQMVGAIPRLSLSRFNRRLHHAQSVLLDLLDAVRSARAPSGLYLIDTLPHERHGYSLVVYATYWRCFGKCSVGRDVIGWIQRYHDLSFQQACEKLVSGDLPYIAQAILHSEPESEARSEPPNEK